MEEITPDIEPVQLNKLPYSTHKIKTQYDFYSITRVRIELGVGYCPLTSQAVIS